MSFANPTSLRLGMTGNLSGRNFRVAGRVVLGMEEDGETYFWNEFNLVDDAGESVTLVFEETERGGQWKLFTYFEPEFPMTAADAATRKIGDRLNLEGADVRVTLVDESRVYHIEGEAPEGVEVGDVAHYFNAEARNTMIVVSWTGDEVEYYRGEDLSRFQMKQAFSVADERPLNLSRLSGSAAKDGGFQLVAKWLIPAIVLAVVALVFGLQFSSCKTTRRVAAVTRIKAAAPELKVGGSGRLGAARYRIERRVRTEIAEVGRVFNWHEYELTDEDGRRALLIQGFIPGSDDMVFFSPLTPSEPLTPEQAAAARIGETVNVDGVIAPVKAIFQSVRRESEGSGSHLRTGEPSFGFTAQAGTTTLLVRWSQGQIAFHRGAVKDLKAVKAAFGP